MTVILNCPIHATLPLARQASEDLSSQVFVLSLVDGKISQFHGVFHSQPWEGHHFFYSQFQTIALSGVGCRHDGEGTLADVCQLKTIWGEDIDALLKVARCRG
jgi:hypothetical protein